MASNFHAESDLPLQNDIKECVISDISLLNQNTASFNTVDPDNASPATALQVIKTQENIGSTVVNLQFGPDSQRMICPLCHLYINTITKTSSTWRTRCMAIRLSLILCCCCPYLCKVDYITYHSCPNCKAFLGHFKE